MELGMDTDKAAGAVQEVAGKVQDSVGDSLGDTTTQLKGKARELGGKVQQLYADTATVVREKATESPLGALALIAVASFLMGVLWSNSGSNWAPKRYPRES
jgi:uncharacterized protein YjbJ (UPF0337 family)